METKTKNYVMQHQDLELTMASNMEDTTDGVDFELCSNN